ncbi:MAG: hypothetical protein ACYTA3_04015 [Planctomycetota bacterium]|jgi:hypothetical protein
MFELKALSKESVAAALEKAERYRLLNESWEAGSICRDILEADPENQGARIVLLLSLTDQFRTSGGEKVLETAREVVEGLRGEYERAYYSGIICERKAKAILARSSPGSGPVAYDWLRRAMEWYEKAEALRPPGNDDPVLRWNTCARMIMRDGSLRPEEGRPAPVFLE